MVYRRYGGNVKDIFSMPFFDGYELISYALDAELEEKLFLRWVAGYQFAMEFKEFKAQAGGYAGMRNMAKTDNRTAGEILDTVKDIIG